jgi:hypothetical protein
MKISFIRDERSIELELSLEKYKKLKELINKSSDEKEALCFCDTLNEDCDDCYELIAYEFAQKKGRESLPIEIDSSCDYDDHL